MTVRATDLPTHLAERTTPVGPQPIRPEGDRVVYWMRTAVRGHENPALDTAQWLATRLDRPLLVYHAASERYPFASDRHHRFILEGARDVAGELAARGIAYALHVERPGHRQPALKALAAQAAAIITEDMPWAPLDRWTRAVADEAACAVWRVDTACLVPLPVIGRAYDRAFRFRQATEDQRAARLTRDWPDPDAQAQADPLTGLPFEPVEIAGADLGALIGACAIDHTVGPIAHTPGGSRAGYRRWAAFKAGAIKRYAKRRNDAADRTAVSRLSPYIHYGQVSPFRLAREAAAQGADKWLEEFLVWREMAYAFARFGPDVDSLDGVPDWAREDLKRGEDDRREAIHSWETMARAATGNRLWDAAQRSLLRQGELHNNLRMSWGKAIVGWTADAQTALDRLIDLNHRYALDGRDPNSYGGLLWCLGQFDRPFDPPTPVFGRVRGRSLAKHAERLDLDAYEAAVARPSIDYEGSRGPGPRIAVIGAGMAGAIAARTLADHGFAVRVFDKGRGAGGRMATRRGTGGPVDHGAQYFTARDPHFRRLVDSWVADGVVAPWRGHWTRWTDEGTADDMASGDRFVGTPGMSAVLGHLTADLDIAYGAEVAAIAWDGAAWSLAAPDGTDLGRFDWVLIATPAPQAGRLLRPDAPDMAAALDTVAMAPCWAVWLALDTPLHLDSDGGAVTRTGQPLAWVARDSGKPARPDGEERWVLHASPEWSQAHLEEDRDDVAETLRAAFSAMIGQPVAPSALRAHRWRYARTTQPLARACLIDVDRGLGLAGDWCLGAKVEAAYRSGAALAGRVMHALVDTAGAPSPVAGDHGAGQLSARQLNLGL